MRGTLIHGDVNDLRNTISKEANTLDPPDPRFDAQFVPRPGTLRRWARAAIERDLRVTLRFVDGHESRALNRRYRGRDRATNVLTFVYDDGAPLEGDIVLCASVIRREARAPGRAADPI